MRLASSAPGADHGWIDRPSWFALPAEPSLLRTTLAIGLLAVGSGALSDVRTESSGEGDNRRVTIYPR